jgi:hypothetical protein
MKIKEDLTGKKFGKLTVISRDINKIGLERGSFWNCECECGEKRSVSRHSLVNHGTKSCGCLQKEFAMSQALPDAEADKRYWLSKYKRRAKKLGIEFSLKDSEFYDICSMDCFYCGDSPVPRDHGYVRKNDTGIYKANGIDKIDPDGGYTKDNSVPCCTPCNMMKTDKSQEDFINRAIKIANKHRS